MSSDADTTSNGFLDTNRRNSLLSKTSEATVFRHSMRSVNESIKLCQDNGLLPNT